MVFKSFLRKYLIFSLYLSIQSEIIRQSIQGFGSGIGADDVNLVDETSKLTK